MAEELENQEKSERPSQYRIDEFRRKGQVAASKELTSVLILLVGIFVLGISLLFIYQQLSLFMEWLYGLDLEQAWSKKYFKEIVYRTLQTAVICAGPILLATFFIGVLVQIAQIGFIYAPSVIEVKFSKINPVGGLKRLLSVRSLAEAIKGLFKFIVIIGVTVFFLINEIWFLKGFLQGSVLQSFLHGKAMALKLGYWIITGLVVLAGLDLLWEKFQYQKKLRQTRQQLREETKEKEGNPEIKQRIRSIQRKMAQSRMMQEVPKADVVLTNPSHISVAIKYHQGMLAPRVVAKGADQLAFKIRQLALRHGVPMVENAGLARTLYRMVPLGKGIPQTLYKAVAEVLAFVYGMGHRGGSR